MTAAVEYIAPFVADPHQIAPWRDLSPVVCLHGGAGSGKSRLAAEKVHGCCLRYPGATWLMLRKTRESMVNSTVLFYERTIVGNDPRVRHVPSKHRFEYWNGSIAAYGGMADEQQREQIRSIGQDGGLDGAWVEEAKALKEQDYNEVMGRMRGRKMGWRQILLTTNPDSPLHWIYKRLIMGKEASSYPSLPTDNPRNDPAYLAMLNRLTGVQRLRLLLGQWVRAEGAVYDNWSEKNVDGDIAKFDPSLPVIWVIDDGYKNPRVILVAQIKPNGTYVLIDEYYETEAMPDTSIRDVLDRGYEMPYFAIYDPSAVAFAAFLNEQGIQTVAADNNVSEGIKTVRQYIRDGNEKISLYVHPRCVHTIEEMANYEWSSTGALQGGDPKPIKEHDHTCDAVRYLLHTPHALSAPRAA